MTAIERLEQIRLVVLTIEEMLSGLDHIHRKIIDKTPKLANLFSDAMKTTSEIVRIAKNAQPPKQSRAAMIGWQTRRKNEALRRKHRKETEGRYGW